jgi:hypothetical protein
VTVFRWIFTRGHCGQLLARQIARDLWRQNAVLP